MTLKDFSHNALIVDDDPDCRALISAALAALNINAILTRTPEEFLQTASQVRAHLCLIDLNLGTLDQGFGLIEKIRKQLGPKFPIFVISARSDSQSIAHAMELGADDYLVKPIDKELLATKLLPHISSPEILSATLSQQLVPEKKRTAEVSFQLRLLGIDEFGITFMAPHLLSKGAAIQLASPLIGEFSLRGNVVLLRITTTWALPDGKGYGGYAEFDISDDGLISRVRRWLAKRIQR